MTSLYGPHRERLKALAIQPNSRFIVIGGYRDAAQIVESTVHRLQLPKGTTKGALAVESAVTALHFIDPEHLLIGLKNGTLQLWSVRDDQASAAIPAHDGPVQALAGEGGYGISVGADGVCKRWRYQREIPSDPSFAKEGQGGFPTLTLLDSHVFSHFPLYAVVWDASRQRLIAGGEEGLLYLWQADPPDASPRTEVVGEGGIYSLHLTGDGQILIGCGDGRLYSGFVDGALDAEMRHEAGHDGPLTGIALSPPSVDARGQDVPRSVFSIGTDGQLKIWRLDQRRAPRTLALSRQPLTGIAVLPTPTASRSSKGTAAESAAPTDLGTLIVIGHDRQIHLDTLNPLFLQAENTSTPPLQKGGQGGISLTVWASDIERLTRAATDPDASYDTREQAINTLHTWPEDEARLALEQVVQKDPRPPLRTLAAQHLGTSGRRLSRAVLQATLNEGYPQLHQAALKSLLTLSEDDPYPVLQTALRTRHEDLRQMAIKAAPRLLPRARVVPLLVEALRDTSYTVQHLALQTLLTVEAAQPLVALRTAFEKGMTALRTDVLQHLSQRADLTTPDGRHLLQIALTDAEPVIREQAFWIRLSAHPTLLGRLQALDPSIVRLLHQARLNEVLPPLPDPPGAVSDTDRTPLFHALASPHADIALLAARCLALLGDNRAMGPLIQLSGESTPAIRLATLQVMEAAYATLPTPRLLDQIQWLLNDEQAEVRAHALKTLLTLARQQGPRRCLEVAEMALQSQAADVRQQALEVAIHSAEQDTGALKALAQQQVQQALDDEEATVRDTAFRTVWRWHRSDPQTVLTLAVQGRYTDIRRRAVEELAAQTVTTPTSASKSASTSASTSSADASAEKLLPALHDWARALLLERITDGQSEVGLAAYNVLTQDTQRRKAADVHHAALHSPQPTVRAAGAKGAAASESFDSLRSRLIELLSDEISEVYLAAIETLDQRLPDDAMVWAVAFNSPFYTLQVRAGECCGIRRDRRASGPLQALLSLPRSDVNRPNDGLRERAARALADVGDPAALAFYARLLADDQPVVAEMAARGLATAAQPGDEDTLVTALAHANLAVRSWAAEGLARLGDRRAIPVLAGTQRHAHVPIRQGALLGFMALGEAGMAGVLAFLDDPERHLQELVMAWLFAREIALVRTQQPPDVMLTALAARSPDLRYAAARCLESRAAQQDLIPLAMDVIGPRVPEKASDLKAWPSSDERQRLLGGFINALNSDTSQRRYAATQVLKLRTQPLSFWREARYLLQGQAIPHTNWSDETPLPPPPFAGLRRLFSRLFSRPVTSPTHRILTVLRQGPTASEAAYSTADLQQLAFGTYAGLVRQTPPTGPADEHHRIRRDSLERLVALAQQPPIGREAVLTLLEAALEDPHHLVRRVAFQALQSLNPTNAIEPLTQALQSRSVDVTRLAFDVLQQRILAGDTVALQLVQSTVHSPLREVRHQALERLPRLYPPDSIEPWLIAMQSPFADVRLAVIDRLKTATDPRVIPALQAALQSDQDDLRLQAAEALAERGKSEAAEALVPFLRHPNANMAGTALNSLKELASWLIKVRPVKVSGEAAVGAQEATDATQEADAVLARMAQAIGARLLDDPDHTADQGALIDALARIAHPQGAPALQTLLMETTLEAPDQATTLRPEQRSVVWNALLTVLRERQSVQTITTALPDSRTRPRYRPIALDILRPLLTHRLAAFRCDVLTAVADIDSLQAEQLLSQALRDRDEKVRAHAAQALRQRLVDGFGTATLEPLAAALRSGRRELIVPAACGLAVQQRPEAWQPLLLALKAGTPDEQAQAARALGQLGDARALALLEPLLSTSAASAASSKASAASAMVTVEQAACEGLGYLLKNLKDTDEKKSLYDRLETMARDSRHPLRLASLTALRHAGEARSRAVLERIALNPRESFHIRQRALTEWLAGNPPLPPLLQRGEEKAGEISLLQGENPPLLQRGAGGILDGAMSLLNLLDDSHPYLRQQAWEGFCRLFANHPTPLYRRALASPFSDIHRPATRWLARHAPQDTVAQLPTSDRHARPLLSRTAIREQISIELPLLIELLQSDDPTIITEAARLAGYLQSAEQHKEQQATYPEALYAAIRQAIHTAMAAWQRTAQHDGTLPRSTRSSGSVGYSVETASVLDDWTAAWQASLWAADMLGMQVIDLARSTLADAHHPSTVRYAAIRLLAHGGVEEQTRLTALLADADQTLRTAAATALTQLTAGKPDLRDVPTLDPALFARPFGVMPTASTVAPPEKVPATQQAVATPAPVTPVFNASQARDLLPTWIAQRNVEAVLKWWDDPTQSDQDRQLAIASLGRIGGPFVEQTLDRILTDKALSDGLRAAAFKAKRRLQRQQQATATYQAAGSSATGQ